MASNIVTTTLDENYPIAGRDNDTQGFRDNFGIIKANFNAAKAEIEDLQDNVLRRDKENTLGGSKIVDANIQASTEVMYSDLNINSAIVPVQFTSGHYHKYNLTDPSSTYTFNLEGWPDSSQESRLAKITIELLSTEGEKTITWTGTGQQGISVFKKSANWPTEFTVPLSNTVEDYTPVLVEFWSYDGGNTIYANFLGSFV